MKDRMEFVLGLVPEGRRAEARAAIEEMNAAAAARPAEIEVPESEVVGRYPVTDAVEVVRCRKEMLLHVSNYWLVVRPGVADNMAGGSLYQALKWFCDSIDSPSDSEEGRKTSEEYRSLMVTLLTLPLEMFGDVEYSVDLALAVLSEKRKYYGRLAKDAALIGAAPETEADAASNAEFVDAVRRVGAVAAAVERLAGDDHEG